MNRITLLSCAVLAAALSLNACKKDKKEDKAPAATDTPATETGKTTEATATDQPATPPPTEPATPPPTEPAAPPARPANVTDDQVKLADDFVAAVEGTAAAIEGAKGDCKGMAKAITTEAAKMKPMMKKLEAMKTANEKDTAMRDWFKATYEAKVMESFGKIMTGVTPCKDDKAVQAALKSIGPSKKEVAPADGAGAAPSK
jgi:hypothetical protein